MDLAKIPVIVIVCFLGALAACSKTAPNGANVDTASMPQVAPGNACERKLIEPEDAAAVLGAPVTATKTIPGDPQSCQFSTSGFSSVTISLRPGHGKAALGTYTSGKMNDYEKSEPLAGVGDEAVRSLELNRIIARKDDLLCEITGPGVARASGDPRCKNSGALCNKIFAAN